MATNELTSQEQAPAARREDRVLARPEAADGSSARDRRSVTLAQDLGALGVGVAVGAVIGVALVFLIVWLAG